MSDGQWPVGGHLHSYPADGAYPIFAMVFPRDWLDDLIHRRLTPEDVWTTRNAATELSERVTAESCLPMP